MISAIFSFEIGYSFRIIGQALTQPGQKFLDIQNASVGNLVFPQYIILNDWLMFIYFTF